VFALIVLRWDFGRDVVSCLSSKVSTFLGYTGQESQDTQGIRLRIQGGQETKARRVFLNRSGRSGNTGQEDQDT
jgi:hypothetical protein